MQVVIEISEEQYNALCMRGVIVLESQLPSFLKALRKGTVLPKDHGDLIDADMTLELLCMDKCRVRPSECPFTLPCNAKHIIDKMKEHPVVPATKRQVNN